MSTSAIVSTPTAASESRRPCARVLGFPVDSVRMETVLDKCLDLLRRKKKGYVCAIGVHGLLEALANASIAKAFLGAAIVVPDGTPMFWIGHLQGHRQMSCVRGPDLMEEILSRPELSAYSHFFYGGKEGVAEELAAVALKKFPWLRVVGTYTPPFRDLTRAEKGDFIQMIHERKPDIIWVGISTPKQDLFMHQMLPYLDTTLMFGVGAAFDFHTGHIKDCPAWIKTAGFHWLHRLMQDPKRLWRRNLKNMAFLVHIILQLTGLRSYRTQEFLDERMRFSPDATMTRSTHPASTRPSGINM